MNTNQLFHFAAWSAYLNAVVKVMGAVSLALLFAGNQAFGRISDSSSVFFSLLLIPCYGLARLVCLLSCQPLLMTLPNFRPKQSGVYT